MFRPCFNESLLEGSWEVMEIKYIIEDKRRKDRRFVRNVQELTGVNKKEIGRFN